MLATCRMYLLFATLLLGVFFPDTSFAWGAVGHRFLTHFAISELPTPLRTFYQNCSNRVTNNAANEPVGTHYINIDYYPEFFAGIFPRDVNVLISEYGANTVTNNGMAPWTAVSHYENLRLQMLAAQTPADWTNLLTTASVLAHYLEDLHNPMHLTTNYNGVSTGQTGIHSRYESSLIQYRINAGFKLATNPADCVYYSSLRDAIFNDIAMDYTNNATILAADLAATAAAGETMSTNYYQHLWDDGCSSFTPAVMQKAAGMVASAWYSAWREAGFPQPPGVNPATIFSLKLVSCDNSNCTFTINGDAGQVLEIQTSVDLFNWSHQTSVTNYDGRFEVMAPLTTTNAQSFYRAVLVR